MLCSSAEFLAAAWLWIYRSIGVSHRVWFMIAWLMRISILYGLLTSTAHKLHLLLFSLIQGHEIGEEKSRLPLNNGNLSVPLELTGSSSKARLKVCRGPWAVEAQFNVYHIFHLHIQPVVSWFRVSQRDKKASCKERWSVGEFPRFQTESALLIYPPSIKLVFTLFFFLF